MDSQDTGVAQAAGFDAPVVDAVPVTDVTSTANNARVVSESPLVGAGGAMPPSSAKARKSKMLVIIGVIVGLVTIAIVIAVVISMSNSSSAFNDPFGSIDDLNIDDELSIQKGVPERDAIVDKLAADFEKGTISADDYVMQLAYSLFEPDEVNDGYKSLEHGVDDVGALLSAVQTHLDDLSDETVEYIWDYLFLGSLRWDVGDEVGLGNHDPALLASEPYKDKQSAGKLGVISDVELSKDGHFLIFYGTSGKNATTKDAAKGVGDYLETVAAYYKSEYGYGFQYETISTNTSHGEAVYYAKRMLERHGIDSKYLNTAMPVYLINIEYNHAAGFYVAGLHDTFTNVLADVYIRIDNILRHGGKSESHLAMLGTYSSPFFAVNIHGIGSETYDVVLAHELFHHYQKYICGSGNYVSSCPSGNFTVETTANIAGISASGVNSTNTELNSYHGYIYIRDIEMSLDHLGDGSTRDDGGDEHGYGAYIFGYNYMDVVEDGARRLFESSKCSNALKCLFNSSDGMYDKAFLKMAERTLTLDYDNKTYIPYDGGAPIYPAAHGEIEVGDAKKSKQETIAYSSQHYYYVDPSKFSEKAQIAFKTDSSSLHLLLFVRDGDGYKYLYSQSLNKDFVINIGTFCHYREVAFAVVDTAISGSAGYTVETDSALSATPSVTVESLKLETCERLSGNYKVISCYEVEDQEMMTTVHQMYVSFDDSDMINDMYAKATIRLKRDENKQIFGIAQTITSSLILAVKNSYKEQFKDIEMKTTESEDTYTVTVRVMGDYYKSFKGYSFDDNSKLDIGRAIEEEGYRCLYY